MLIARARFLFALVQGVAIVLLSGSEQLLELARLAAPVLRRRLHLCAQRGRGVPGPARVVQHAARQSDQIGLAALRRSPRPACGSVIRPTAIVGRPSRGLMRVGQTDLIAGAERNLLLRRHAAAGHMDGAQPRAAVPVRTRWLVSTSQPPFDPVGGRMRTPPGLSAGPGGAHCVEHFQRKAHAVLQAAAEGVGRAGWPWATGTGAAGSRGPHAPRSVESQTRGASRGATKASRTRARPAASSASGASRRRCCASRTAPRRPGPGFGAAGGTARRRPRGAAGGLAAGVAELDASGIGPNAGAPRASTRPARPRCRRRTGPGSRRDAADRLATAVASRISRPAPDSAIVPRWIRCQSVAEPSTAEYWHIGAMTMRLGRVRGPRGRGVKRALIVNSGSCWACRRPRRWRRR
jgi:hypothetical protein